MFLNDSKGNVHSEPGTDVKNGKSCECKHTLKPDYTELSKNATNQSIFHSET